MVDFYIICFFSSILLPFLQFLCNLSLIKVKRILTVLMIVCLSVRCDDVDTTAMPDNRSILNKTDPIKKPSIDRTKEIIFCEVEKTDDNIYSSCDLKSLNFTFYALFRPKRSLHFKNLLELKKSLSNSSTCEIRYMKVIFKSSSC